MRVLLALSLAATAPAFAAEHVLVLDAASTRVSFVLDATAHEVEGRFQTAAGELRFDPESGSAGGQVTIDARSGETGNVRRDRTMHSKVLESERFPTIVFRPERIEGGLPAAGTAGEMHLHGTLEIHGAEHPLSILARVAIADARVAAEAAFSIPYVEWGMKDPSVFVLRVAKTVEVRVSAVGTLSR